MRHRSRMNQTTIFVVLLIIGIFAGSITAYSKDAIVASVIIPDGQPQPLITENGKGYTPGTYAIGTIVLNYTVVASQFPVGPIGSFDLQLAVYDSGGKQEPSYPVALTLDDPGSPDLTLIPSVSTVQVIDLGWKYTVPVSIVVSEQVAEDPDMNSDGAELVSSLRLSTPGGSSLDTVTNILVKVKLVHPTACLKVYDFITDEAFTETITSTEVNVNASKQEVNSTNPYGSLSQNTLIANVCSIDQSFDLSVFLDSAFSRKPAGNPGNAVFTFSTNGEIDPEDFDITSFGTGTPQGQDLCLRNVTVPANSTFLATVHMSIIKKMSSASLPPSGVFEGFEATLFGANSGCEGSPIAATPNPVTAPLSFTIK